MKVSGSIPVSGGVSQLPPYLRHAGAVGEQVNFISDPAVGVARRHGSVFQGEFSVGAQPPASFTDAQGWRSTTWHSGGGEYVVLTRAGTRTPGCAMPAVQVWDVKNKQFLGLTQAPSDTLLESLHSGGVSAFCGTSKFGFLAGNTITPVGSVTPAYLAAESSSQGAVWVRGGVSDRTYTVTVQRSSGAPVTVKYTTPQAAYPGILDTSSIPWYKPVLPPASETATVPVSVLEAPSRGLVYLPHSMITLVSVTVTDSEGRTISPVSSPMVVQAQRYFLPLGDYASVPAMFLSSAHIGDTVTVAYSYKVIGTSTVLSSTEIRVVGQAERQGYAFLTQPFSIGHPSISGLTLKMADWGNLADTAFFYNPDMSPSYMLFHAAQIGKTVTALGQRPKMETNGDYQRLVDDAKIGYERNVTAYLLEAAHKTTPAYIAEELRRRLADSGVSTTRFESHIAVSAHGLVLTVDDGGDGTMLRAADSEVASTDDLTDWHFPGKVVKVRPADGTAYFYLVARAKGTGAGFQEVIWTEGAGEVQTVTQALCFLYIAGSTAYLASTPAHMQAISGTDCPDYQPSGCGDSSQIPPLAFLGSKITLLTLFQDRLLIGSGGTLTVSASGDYLRLYPSSVVTVPADSAFEVKAQGSDSDTLRHAAFFGRDLFIFGDIRQYAITGQQVLAPTNASLSVISSLQRVADVAPVSVGGLLFLAAKGERGTAVSQMRPSLDPDNPDIISVSTSLTSYLGGGPLEMARRNNPDTVYLRAKGRPNKVFAFRFTDGGQGRAHEAWYCWQFADKLGTLLAIRPTVEGVIAFFLRQGVSGAYLVADLCQEAVELSDRPYLDSLRPLSTLLAGGSTTLATTGWFAAYSSEAARPFIGSSLEGLAQTRLLYGDAGLWIGAPQSTSVEITAPTPKDRNGSPNRQALLTVGTVSVSASDSSGLYASTPKWAQPMLVRRVGDSGVIGQVPVGDWQQVVAVAQNAKDLRLSLSAMKWYPLTITGVDYTGQLFDRPVRL